MHAFCLGYGPGFRKGATSDVPCGIVDIAPTVCHLLGLTQESGFDGRVLHEGLRGNSSLSKARATFYVAGTGAQRQPIQLARVNDTPYILGCETAFGQQL